LLQELGDQQVHVVSICGQKGVGKSYIGNVLVNRFGGKGVSHIHLFKPILVPSPEDK
jgi:polynucleotide 5'-kinase involved in rRNA processing